MSGKQPMRIDLDEMPETPQHRGIHHRRAHSDTSFRFDDLLLFDPSDLDLSSLDLLPSPNPTPPRVQTMSVDSSDDSTSNWDQNNNNNNSQSSQTPPKPKPINHLRSLSVDSDFFDSLSLTAAAGASGGKSAAVAEVGGGGEKRSYHRHSNSMDGSIATSFEIESVIGDGVKKAMDRDRLAELALIDPKRAKR